jgi:hypothetical protein
MRMRFQVARSDRHVVSDVPLRCHRFCERMRLVDLTSASWNHITSWLHRVDALRDAA